MVGSMNLDPHTLFVVTISVDAIAENGMLLVRVVPERADPCRGVVGRRALPARRGGGAVRTARRGRARDHFRPPRHDALVDDLRSHLVRRPRYSTAASRGWSFLRRGRDLARGLAHAHLFVQSPDLKALLSSGIIAAYTWLAAYEFWKGRPEPLVSRWPIIFVLFTHGALFLLHTPLAALLHPGRLPVRCSPTGAADGPELRGAAVSHHRHRLHPAGHGKGADRAPAQDRLFGGSAHRHRQSPRLPDPRRRGYAQRVGDGRRRRGPARRPRQFQIHQRPLRTRGRRSRAADLRRDRPVRISGRRS